MFNFGQKNYNLQIIPHSKSGKLDFLSRETTVSAKSRLFAGGENGVGCIGDRCKDIYTVYECDVTIVIGTSKVTFISQYTCNLLS